MKKNKGQKPDNSPHIQQREKVKDAFSIREFPWTEKQKKFINISNDKNTKIIICRACAGVGKTLLATFCSLALLKEKRIGEILYLRIPVESCSHGVGYLSGDKTQKLDAHSMPLSEHLHELLDKPTINKLILDERIKVDSIGFIKGRTFHNMAVIADECEDLNKKEAALLMNRMGRFSKLYIIGDANQSDIRDSSFNKVFEAFNTEEAKLKGIHTFEFTKEDCMRSEITKFIIETFEKMN